MARGSHSAFLAACATTAFRLYMSCLFKYVSGKLYVKYSFKQVCIHASFCRGDASDSVTFLALSLASSRILSTWGFQLRDGVMKTPNTLCGSLSGCAKGTGLPFILTALNCFLSLSQPSFVIGQGMACCSMSCLGMPVAAHLLMLSFKFPHSEYCSTLPICSAMLLMVFVNSVSK